MQVNSNHAAAARKHLVRQLYMSGVRPNIICTLYTCNLIPAHVRDTRSQAGVHLTCYLQSFRAQFTTADCHRYCYHVYRRHRARQRLRRHSRPPLHRFPIPPRTASWRSKAYWQQPAARNAASNDAHKSRIHGRVARAAHGEKEPALGRHGRPAPPATARSRSTFSSKVEDFSVHEIQRDRVTAGGHARP